MPNKKRNFPQSKVEDPILRTDKILKKLPPNTLDLQIKSLSQNPEILEIVDKFDDFYDLYILGNTILKKYQSSLNKINKILKDTLEKSGWRDEKKLLQDVEGYFTSIVALVENSRLSKEQKEEYLSEIEATREVLIQKVKEYFKTIKTKEQSKKELADLIDLKTTEDDAVLNVGKDMFNSLFNQTIEETENSALIIPLRDKSKIWITRKYVPADEIKEVDPELVLEAVEKLEDIMKTEGKHNIMEKLNLIHKDLAEIIETVLSSVTISQMEEVREIVSVQKKNPTELDKTLKKMKATEINESISDVFSKIYKKLMNLSNKVINKLVSIFNKSKEDVEDYSETLKELDLTF